MRKNIDEIMDGIKQKSEKGIKRKKAQRKALAYSFVSLLLIAAVCTGFMFYPFKDAAKDTPDVLESGSAEQSLPGSTVDKSRYLPITQLSANLMDSITANGAEGKEADAAFLNAYADFGMKLFNELYTEGENALVSPLSVMYAFAMLANGAEGETKAQIETALGGIDTETLNRYLYSLSAYLEGKEVNISNSVWVKDSDSFLVNLDFLQTNANYYDADLYKTAFDEQTVKDVNAWASEKTNGMIEKIVDKYNGREIMQLINAICFEAEWDVKAEDTQKHTFQNANGSESQTDFMCFKYGNKYIATDNAEGFIKDYKGGKYSFVALMPKENIDINSYITSLDGKAFMSAVQSTENESLTAWMPKFKYNCSMDLIPTLKSLGMEDVFSSDFADLTGLGTGDGNLYVSAAKQDTFIEVSELGTRAAAVTSVGVDTSSSNDYICIDRPFVYAIIDTATGLPLFTGAVTTL